jgi:hypothetical protein
MEPSTSDLVGPAATQIPWLTAAALVCAAGAAAILLWYLVRRPPLGPTTKVALLFGFGVLPLGAALSGNLVGFEETTTRAFCGSCHTMEPYTDDAADPASVTLAAMHSRNEHFGPRSCYTCHSDYGMFGTVATKINGLRHVWMYYTEYRSIPIEESLPRIEIYAPIPNYTCTRCHSTTLPGWSEVPDHVALSGELRDGRVSCTSDGCHGPAHPFSKVGRGNRP